MIKLLNYLALLFAFAFTGISAQNHGIVSFKNVDIKEGLIENNGS